MHHQAVEFDGKDLAAAIEERRRDTAFTGRLADRLTTDAPILERLATGARQVTLATGVVVTTDRPIIELAEYQRRSEVVGFRYECPSCGNIASTKDWPPAQGHRAAQECIGRALAGLGCDWAAFGLLGADTHLLVRMPNGEIVEAFPPAPAPSSPGVG